MTRPALRALLIVLLLTACGVEGPPVPPAASEAAAGA